MVADLPPRSPFLGRVQVGDRPVAVESNKVHILSDQRPPRALVTRQNQERGKQSLRQDDRVASAPIGRRRTGRASRLGGEDVDQSGQIVRSARW